MGFKGAIVGAIHESPEYMGIKQRRNMGLSKVIGRFKMTSSKQINVARKMSSVPVWQRNYYEHVVRDETSLNRICEYIVTNPLSWEKDDYYCSATGDS